MFNLHLLHIKIPTGKSLKLIPFGDVHHDVELCDKERWKHFLYRCRVEDDEHTYYIELGDPNDFASISERSILLNRKLHESTVKKLDRLANIDTNAFLRDVGFMKGRMIGIVSGNHRWEFKDGSNSDQRIAKALDSKFLGDFAFIRLALEYQGRFVNVDIVACHGKAGGKCAGTTINQVDDLRRIFPVADIYLCGHDHKRGVWPESTLLVSTNGKRGELMLKQKRQLLCRTGSFLRGYVDGEDSYVSNKYLRPCELGTIKLEIKVKRSVIGDTDSTMADIHAQI
jgi:hypothetical protein